MNQSSLKNLLPHLGAIVVFIILSVTFFKPAAFDGKVLQTTDITQAKGMQHELRDYKNKTGKAPLWTNGMFSGMPTYQIWFDSKNPLRAVYKTSLLGKNVNSPVGLLFSLMAGMYVLFIVLRLDWRIALLGAIGFGLSANHIILIEAGHLTKLAVTAYIAPALGGVLLTFRKKYLLGGSLFALSVAMQLYCNHPQMTYYFLTIMLIFGIVKLIQAFKNNELPHFGKAVGVLLVGLFLAFSANISKYWTTYEYMSETIRGESELTKKGDSSGSAQGVGGLSKDYAFNWSYGIGETFNLLIPNYVGGTSMEHFAMDRNSESSRALQKLNNPQQFQSLARATSHYWGTQPFTSGPVYIGAVLWFLFFIGVFLANGITRNWVVIAVLFTIMIAWGKNFSMFNYPMFDYFPFFNNFRATTMILGITNLLVVFLGVLGLQQFFNQENSDSKRTFALYGAGGITGGLILIAYLFSFSFSYGVEGKGLPETLATALAADRASLLSTDIFRSFLFVALAFAALWVYLKKSFNSTLLIAVLGLLTIIDLWGVDRRFIDEERFVTVQKEGQIAQPAEVDKQIQQDPDPHFRVADFRGSPFQNALTSYHHKSVGGYHAAKLMRYQELIERYLGDPGKNGHIYGMLNTKYFINQDGRPIQNPNALGNAWFVKNFEIVADGDEEIAALADLNPKDEAVLQEKYAGDMSGWKLNYDSTSSIKLSSYYPDEMVYTYSAKSEQLAMFSEIYYPPSKGWKVYLDGEEITPFIKANFLLRALRLPAGNNRELKMVFHPTSYYTGETITIIAAVLLMLIFFGGIALYFKSNGLPNPDQLPEVTRKEKVGRATNKLKKTKPGRKTK